MLSPLVAIKKYIEHGTDKMTTSRELIDFKKACTEQEWKEFSAQAGKNLGEEVEVPKG